MSAIVQLQGPNQKLKVLRENSIPVRLPSLSLPFPATPNSLPPPRQAHHGCAWRRNFLKIKSPVTRKTHFQNIKTFLRRRSSLSLCLFLNSWSEINIVVL